MNLVQRAVPAKADKPIFVAAPLLFIGAAAAFIAFIPVAPGWVVADVDMGLIAIFAVIGFFPIITVLSAWSSNSKFPFIGGIRALHQMVSFEIPLILSCLGVVILTGTLNLSEIVQSQSFLPWIIFMPIGAVVFFICALAELERIPFDLPEAESEIVAGWLTEFSGMMYGLVQLGSYLKLYAFAALFVVLFLGGWNGPTFWPPLDAQLVTDGITMGPIKTSLPGLPIFSMEFFSAVGWFVLKTVGVIFFILLPRGVFPAHQNRHALTYRMVQAHRASVCEHFHRTSSCIRWHHRSRRHNVKPGTCKEQVYKERCKRVQFQVRAKLH